MNYNIENNQYVVAGELGNLNVLGLVLSELKKDPKKAADVVPLITSAIHATEESKLANGMIYQISPRMEHNKLIIMQTNRRRGRTYARRSYNSITWYRCPVSFQVLRGRRACLSTRAAATHEA